MRMSTKGRFAVNALIDLALRAPAGPVSLLSISQRLQVSLSYLEQLFSRLRRDGLVESTRGPGGGYTLGRDAAQISVADIVRSVDEGGEDPAAAERSLGLTEDLCQRLGAQMLQHMAGISLQALVQEQVAKGAQLATATARRAPASPPAEKPRRRLVPNSVFAFARSFAT